MGNFLKVPEPPPRARVQRDQAVREQVIPQVSHSYKIGLGTSGRDIGNATHVIHCHPRPAIGSVFFCAIPGFVTEFPGCGTGVKSPQQFSANYVEAPHVLLETWNNDDLLENSGPGGGRTEPALSFAGKRSAAALAKTG